MSMERRSPLAPPAISKPLRVLNGLDLAAGVRAPIAGALQPVKAPR